MVREQGVDQWLLPHGPGQAQWRANMRCRSERRSNFSVRSRFRRNISSGCRKRRTPRVCLGSGYRVRGHRGSLSTRST
eukprot:8021697-Heterocapsa_arctica.AAC.1